MIEAIFPGLYRIEIPLPGNPLKMLNSYFIRGDGRGLIIDTGFNRRECREAYDAAIRELNIDMRRTDIFITHLHGDHSGLVSYLSAPETKVWGGDYYLQASARGNAGPQWSYFADLIKQSGLSAENITLQDHPGYKFASEPFDRIEVVRNGDRIDVGDYHFQCLETSGHAPDHLCLYEADKKILLCGDHILAKITPNITVWGAPWGIERDFLGEYLDNLKKSAELEIDLLLPGHRAVIRDHRRRIGELLEHHDRRLNNILALIGDTRMNGAQVASQMDWDLTFKTWADFPPAQKIFATGEALAHLTHLTFTGRLQTELRDGVVYYSKKP
ncbi:MAG: MBL fold metallo-hydrolase [Gracilibacteraceae bacterium]|jgi:glyoxylase-like metal-dependent hydrolase (beta-lactamase superfamily II)|nr:MBL fold metallo-hydrolase [Gracilibacteraceae bacterium]